MCPACEPHELVNILLVDDKPANLIALESFLTAEDYNIASVTSGKEALVLLSQREFAVILTDVMMPEMDGLEFVTQVKKNETLRDIPIIFMTAMVADLNDMFRGYALGAVDYLQKPLEPEVVKAKVSVFAQLYRQKNLIKQQSDKLLESERREQQYRLNEIERQSSLERARAAMTKHNLEERVAQQLAVANFSRLALLRVSVDDLMQEAARVVRETLAVNMSSMVTITDGSHARELRVGTDWGPDLRTPLDVNTETDEWLRMTLEATEPLIFGRTQQENGVDLSLELKRLGIQSGASVVIYGESEPFGAISVYSLTPRIFKMDETSFLQAMGNVLGIACERQKSENAVRELVRSNHELEQFSFAASHDLQEPLRKMTSFSQLLAQEYRSSLDAEGLTYLDFIVDGANRMKILIDDLLDLSRVGVNEMSKEPSSVETMIELAKGNIDMQIAESAAVIKLGPLPQVYGVTSDLVRLFQNLISNALKYRSEAVPCIDISCVKDGKNWRFCVRDNGIGIEPSYLDKVFVIFKRLHGRDKYPGTGIGLAICKKIVERHSGRIWAESDGKSGTAFYFTLPIARSTRNTTLSSLEAPLEERFLRAS